MRNSKGTHFTDDSCEESYIFFCVVAHDIELIGELREISLNSLSEPPKRFVERFPILLITAIWHLQLYMRAFKKVKLHVSTDVTAITNDCAVAKVLLNIINVFDIVNACLSEVIGVDYT